jgi:hypothetical protein
VHFIKVTSVVKLISMYYAIYNFIYIVLYWRLTDASVINKLTIVVQGSSKQYIKFFSIDNN